MTRVQIPAYTDRWMMGDRYGEITRTYWKKGDIRRTAAGRVADRHEIACVKLDKSNKTVRVLLADCEVI